MIVENFWTSNSTGPCAFRSLRILFEKAENAWLIKQMQLTAMNITYDIKLPVSLENVIVYFIIITRDSDRTVIEPNTGPETTFFSELNPSFTLI